ncbi:MAG: mevalonate kinase [Candidatus Thermoplasmatota archaeon]|nr:mevalonate kinase [Candidatus Thermoplasmatota archaeon]
MMASAPGKIILFGEHAVVYGEPCVSMAVNLRTKVSVQKSNYFESTVDGYSAYRQPHIRTALGILWKDGPVEITTKSEIPSAAGMGSSAALVVASAAALTKLGGSEVFEEQIARTGFEVEYAVQGTASPNDTSVSSHGSAIMLCKNKRDDLKFLWEIEKNGKRWFVHHCEFPDFNVVVGYTGARGRTSEQVAKVKNLVERYSFTRDVVKEIGQITEEGAKALAAGDLKKAGALMTKNHNLLAILGVDTPELQKLVNAALPTSYGAKITGAGGGGCMIALTENPDETAKAIESAGGKAYKVKLERRGVYVE